MGAFFSLLGGLSKGAGEAYGEIDKQRREEKARRNELVSGALLKELQSNESLNEESHGTLAREYFTSMGVPKKDIERLLPVFASEWSDYRTHQKNQDAKTQSEKPIQAAPQTSAPSMEQGASLPGTPLPPTEALPNIPAPPYDTNTSLAQVRFSEGRGRAKAAASDKAEANRTAITEGKEQELKDHLSLIEQYKDNPNALQFLKAIPRPPGGFGASTFVPKGMRGRELKAMKQRQDPNADVSYINDAGYYQVSVGPDKKTINQEFPSTEHVISGPPATGDNFIGIFPKDLAGNATVPGAGYVPLHSEQGGDLVGIIPATQFGSVTQGARALVLPQIDGSSRIEFVQETKATQKTDANGNPLQSGASAAPPVGATPGTAQVAPPVPVLGGSGGARGPKGGGGNGSRPTPGFPALNPFSGLIKEGQVVGGKALTKDEYQSLNAANQGLKAIDVLRAKIKADPNILAKAAMPGALGARLFDAWRGEVQDVIKRLRTGSAANPSEEKFYLDQLPRGMDFVGERFEPGLVDDKLKIYEGFFNGVVTQFGRRAIGGYTPEALKSQTVTVEAPNGERTTVPLAQAVKFAKKGAKIVSE